MREDELKKQLKEFPQNQKIDNDRKEEMKQTLRKEVGKEPKPFHKRKQNSWMAGFAGVAALVIMVVSVLAITGGEPPNQSDLVNEDDETKRPKIQQEFEDNPAVKDYSLSPNGKSVLFVEVENEKMMVKLRDLNTDKTKSLFRAPTGYHDYSWSPNGDYVIYLSAGIEPKKSWVINTKTMEVYNSEDPIHITGKPLWSVDGQRAFFAEDHPIQEHARVMMYDFKYQALKTLYTAKQEGVRYSIEDVEGFYDITVEEKFLEEDRSRHLYLTKDNGEWIARNKGDWNATNQDEEVEPGTKAAIEQNLQYNDEVEIDTIAWSPNESYVVYTKSPKNSVKQEVYIWEVGETKPELVEMEDDTHTLLRFKWNKKSTHFMELYSYGGDNKFLWSVVDAKKERRTKRFPATQEPTWGPEGDQIAFVEGVQKETEAGVTSYQALKVYERSASMSNDSSGKRTNYRIQTLLETENDFHRMEVESWRGGTYGLQVAYRSFIGNEKSTMTFEEVNGGWQRQFARNINLRAFSTPIYPRSRVLKEEPYSLWEETKSKEIELRDDHKVTVSLYNANGAQRVFLKYEDKWFFVQETELKKANITTEQITTNARKEIVITGITNQDGEEVPIKHIISFNPEDDRGNNFNHLAEIPYYQTVDLENDLKPETLSINDSQLFIYAPAHNRVEKINIRKAIGVESNDYNIKLEKVQGQYVFNVSAVQTGEEFYYRFEGFELFDTNLEN